MNNEEIVGKVGQRELELMEAYWLERARRSFPKVGPLYRAKKELDVYRMIEGNGVSLEKGRLFLERGSLPEGEIVMLVSVEDYDRFAKKTAIQRSQSLLTFLPTFTYQLLWGEQLWDKCNCLIDKWDEHFEELVID